MKIKQIIRKILGKKSSPAKRYEQLFQTIDIVHPRNILEIGTWSGGRAQQMIERAKRFNPADTIDYFGFDLFEEMSADLFKSEISKWPPTAAKVQSDLEKSGAKIHLHKGNTMTTLPRAIKELPKMDFVFIDGGHSIETIQSDWDATIQLMHKGTAVIFDDYWPNRVDAGAKPIVDAIDKQRFNVEIMPTIDRFANDEFGELVIRFAKVTLK